LTQSIAVAPTPRNRRVTRVLRWTAITVALLGGVVLTWLAYSEHANSRDVPLPAEAELREHFNRALEWMFANASHISTEDNPMLWLFIREAGRLTGNDRIVVMAADYQDHYLKGTLSQYFFNPNGSEQLMGKQITFTANSADYQRLFAYGATCNRSIREDPQVLALLSPTGCNPGFMWLRSPSCHTHQLMGLRFAQKNHCDPDDETARTVEAVQDDILAELRWDFRVEDAYLQKVMTLLESGRRKDIRPIWIKRILEAQRADGGWDGADIITHLPGNRVLAWEGRLYPYIRTPPQSNLHATAQGLYLLAMLITPPQ
jgi:hypothetical protein